MFVALPLVGIACSSSAAFAAPYVADFAFVALPLVALRGGGGRLQMQQQRQEQRKKQIPFGNDKQRGMVVVG